MHAASGASLGHNGVMMLARAQLGLRCHCGVMWQRLGSEEFARFPPAGVAVVLNSAATAASVLGHPPPPPRVLRGLAAAFAEHCWEDGMTPRGVSMCLWALGTFQIVPARQDYRAWQHALARHAPGMNGREVSAVWIACDRLQWAPEGSAWQQLEEATARELGGSRGTDSARPAAAEANPAPDAIGIVSAWVAWGQLGVVPSPHVERAMLDALVCALPHMHAWHASMSLRALAKLARVDAAEALDAACARVTGLLQERRTLGAWDAAAVLHALACIVATRHRGRVDLSLSVAPPEPQPTAAGTAPQEAQPVAAAPASTVPADLGRPGARVRHVHGLLLDSGAAAAPAHAAGAPRPDTQVGRLRAARAAVLAPGPEPGGGEMHAGCMGGDAPAAAPAPAGGAESVAVPIRRHSGRPSPREAAGASLWEAPEEGSATPTSSLPARGGDDRELGLARRVLVHAASLHKIGRLFENEALLQVRPCGHACGTRIGIARCRRGLLRSSGRNAVCPCQASRVLLKAFHRCCACLIGCVLWYGVRHHTSADCGARIKVQSVCALVWRAAPPWCCSGAPPRMYNA